MALLIPTSFSSYGDATTSEGPGRKYVLAQFRSTADLGWVSELRRELGLSEIKYAAFKSARPQLRRDRNLWARVEAGVGAATIIVIDSGEDSFRAFFQFWDEKGWSDLENRDREINDRVARSVIARSPIAFLPTRLLEAIPTMNPQPLADLREFTPDSIRRVIGMGVRPALVLAARAHAVFDVDAVRWDTDAATTRDAFSSPLAPMVLAEVLASPRVFDVENAKTVAVLNRASEMIASVLQSHLPKLQTSASALVSESASQELDGIQAADVAAGWAREMLETSDRETLGSRFEHVWINGRRIRR